MKTVGQKLSRFEVTGVKPGALDPNGAFEKITDLSFEGKWKVIVFYPKDFTFVCPTELHAFQSRLEDFKTRGCEVVACSTDTAESHWGWLQMEKKQGGIKGVTYPIVADTTKTVSMNYGVLAGEYDYDENGLTIANGPMIAYRGLYLINKEGIVMHELINFFPLGRNVDEALRMLDALVHFEQYGEVCPADWVQGKEAMKATHEGVADYLGKN